jgi:N-acetylglucosamine-6-phosphate deacetylase
MSGAITNACVLTPDERFEPGTIVWDDEGRIEAVGAGLEPPDGVDVTDARGLTLAPGYIDIHVHGGGGYSLATRDAEEIRSYARWVVFHGVTSFLPTICAPAIGEGLEYVRTAAGVTGPVAGGANVLGVNLEGPFVNPERRGALPKGWLAPPDANLFEKLAEAARGHLMLMTVAPELAGAGKVISRAAQRRIKIALGHSNADYETAFQAFMRGAFHVTHAFNAMSFHHREPGILGAALDAPHATIEMVADGVHLHPATVSMLLRSFGRDHIALVTDGVTPAGVADATFSVGDEEASLVGNHVLLGDGTGDGTIAGSAVTMDAIVGGIVELGHISVAEPVRMASTVPARILGLAERKGRIAPGYDADIIALDGEMGVAMTWVAGRLVYSRAS